MRHNPKKYTNSLVILYIIGLSNEKIQSSGSTQEKGFVSLRNPNSRCTTSSLLLELAHHHRPPFLPARVLSSIVYRLI
jgi:hypothetical protein